MLYIDADDGCSRLNKIESAVFLYCRFSLFLKDPGFFQIIKLHIVGLTHVFTRVKSVISGQTAKFGQPLFFSQFNYWNKK